ncbi:hypothetical protein ACTIVE_0923 [Actinomadura verrucosospora]|uniref:Uncharacterized protein n=1 Tax=Actinomadura verrucosospora TaxID=46165 RepID=A0A7D4A3D3_ACTVE|nr:hypothetical protein ACTIVE_0923 [Actinomadura verrucosospora]
MAVVAVAAARSSQIVLISRASG